MSRERDILDLIADAVIISDDETAAVLEVNAAAARLLGYQRDELIGMSLFALSAEPEASRAAFQDRVNSIPLRRYRRRDGGTIALEITTQYGEWHGRGAHIATCREISSRIRTESALRTSEDRFRTLVEHLGVGVCIVDPSEVVLFANESAQRIFATPEGLAGQSLAGFTDETEFAKLREETLRRQGGEKSAYTIWIRRPDGERRELSIIATPQFDHAGAFISTFGIFQDVTEQARLQQSLQRERNLLKTLVNNLPDHVYLRDRENRFILANRAVAEFMGARDPELLVGKRDSDFYPVGVAAEFAADDRLILEEGRSIINQERCDKAASGKMRWTMTTKVPLFDETGEVIGLVGVSRDITDTRETKEALQKSQEQLQQGLKMEAIGRLAGGIAHDFNNLLTVIKGFAELIDVRLPAGDPSKTEVAEIKAAAQRAATLTAQLLAFGRKQVLHPEVIRLNSVVLAMKNMLLRILGEDVELVLPLSDDAGFIKADQGQVEQVIMNLSVNGRDAMPRGGRLSIATENRLIGEKEKKDHPEIRLGDYVALLVSDTGVGMDAATQARIFEPFFTTKGPGKGTGLGLSTVYGIVKQSDGFIYCDSAPGKGATFAIYFPRVSAAEETGRSRQPAAARSAGSETILLVEDEDALRSFLSSTLKKSGYTVVDARDGVFALDELSRTDRAFDVLVTDVVMPRMGGYELAQRVLQSRPGTRVLYMSGYAVESVIPSFAGQKVDLIRKPFDPADFLARLRDVLDRS